MLFRPVRENDLDDIVRLAARAGVGMTSLPHDVGRLAARIRRSIETFAGELPRSQQGFLFVLEDTALARGVGVSAIEVAVGLDEPFYNFRIQKTVRASKALGVYKPQELLNLSYDHTGHSELCTLFLDPAYQRNRNGLLLSKARFLFIAAFREWFSPHLFAELRGCSDEQGQSPFWDALGHHFFDIPFADADRLTGTGMKTFIAELMPAYPIYISLLPEAARGVIGQVHPNTAPARAILEKEGFSWRGSVGYFRCRSGAGGGHRSDPRRARQPAPACPAADGRPAGADPRSPTVNSTTFGRCWWPTKSRSRLTAPRWDALQVS
ncbi:Arginine N-succinyltransferase [Klebsiella pneumoniae]|uniref:Arginine N-succinyltransferase n=1 Tax=Klebsiella pneumoniae TaxID=573 RepID=A0A2X1QEC4_KLEPN|nr:Arginine N-succinyltransferase [Klebsiella pneumoniae]